MGSEPRAAKDHPDGRRSPALELRRHSLGALALLLVCAGVGIWFQTGSGQNQYLTLAGVLLRAGLVLGAVWLAFPQVTELLSRYPWWLLLAGGASLLLLIWRPRTAALVIPLLVLLVAIQWVGRLLQPGQRRRRR